MAQRKPRIAIMGEFSSGKSTLCNLLMGARPLLEKVTATQLPPVLVSYGNAPSTREDLDGIHHPLELCDLASVDLEDTRLVHIFMESDVLHMCDLIDMPGISDPNMSSDVWERVVHLADGILWCTHATQAWRQSEAGVWASLPKSLYENSLMLITRFDKITNDSDRLRVLKRVATETEGMFAGFFPISLTDALAAGDDPDLWVESGAYAFAEAFLEIVQRLSETELSNQDATADVQAGQTDDVPSNAFPEQAVTTVEAPTDILLSVSEIEPAAASADPWAETADIDLDEPAPLPAAAITAEPRIIPRRVLSKSSGTSRPRGTDNVVYLTEQPAPTVVEKVLDFQLRSVFT